VLRWYSRCDAIDDSFFLHVGMEQRLIFCMETMTEMDGAREG